MRKQDAVYRRHNGANILIDPPKRGAIRRRSSLVPTLFVMFVFISLIVVGVFFTAMRFRGLSGGLR